MKDEKKIVPEICKPGYAWGYGGDGQIESLDTLDQRKFNEGFLPCTTDTEVKYDEINHLLRAKNKSAAMAAFVMAMRGGK